MSKGLNTRSHESAGMEKKKKTLLRVQAKATESMPYAFLKNNKIWITTYIFQNPILNATFILYWKRSFICRGNWSKDAKTHVDFLHSHG